MMPDPAAPVEPAGTAEAAETAAPAAAALRRHCRIAAFAGEPALD
jgi:hypothetical protein